MTRLENELNTIWGQPKFVYYVGGIPFYLSDGVTEDEQKLHTGDEVYTLLADGTYIVEAYAGNTAQDMVKF